MKRNSSMKYLKIYEDIDWDNEFEIQEEEDSPLTDDEFVKFLRDKNVHDKFINYLIEYNNNRGKYYDPENYCKTQNRERYINAFYWGDTEEGNNFWLKLHKEWCKYIIGL